MSGLYSPSTLPASSHMNAKLNLHHFRFRDLGLIWETTSPSSSPPPQWGHFVGKGTSTTSSTVRESEGRICGSRLRDFVIAVRSCWYAGVLIPVLRQVAICGARSGLFSVRAGGRERAESRILVQSAF